MIFKFINTYFVVPVIVTFYEENHCLNNMNEFINLSKPLYYKHFYSVQMTDDLNIIFIYKVENDGKINKIPYKYVLSENGQTNLPDNVVNLIDDKKYVNTEQLNSNLNSNKINDVTIHTKEYDTDEIIKQKQLQKKYENEMKSLLKKESETLKLLEQLKFDAIRLAYYDYKNYISLQDETVKKTIYSTLTDILKLEENKLKFDELIQLNIDEMYISNNIYISDEIIKLCKTYSTEIRKKKKNFDHKWDSFEDDVPISLNK